MFTGKEIKPFKDKVWLASPTMHGEELRYVTEAYETNWMSTVGENITEVERIAAEKAGVKYAVALVNSSASMHLCVKFAGEKLYGRPQNGIGALQGRRVFCSDIALASTVNPVVYEGGIPVFIDSEDASWNMDPMALEKAFDLYPDTKLVVVSELFGFPGRVDIIKQICRNHRALLIEDASEAVGAFINSKPCGAMGDYAAIAYDANKIITGTTGGCLLTDDPEVASMARKWATQSREAAPWFQHEEVGYDYRMSNIVAGVIRGQYPYLEEHVARKKAIFDRYVEALSEYPVTFNPKVSYTTPNYWITAMLIDEAAMCRQVRNDNDALYIKEGGKTCPTEIQQVLYAANVEARPVWKPMHLQPMYRMNEFVNLDGSARAKTNAYFKSDILDLSASLYKRGICLPSDPKMTAERQEAVIDLVKKCFE